MNKVVGIISLRLKREFQPYMELSVLFERQLQPLIFSSHFRLSLGSQKHVFIAWRNEPAES